MSWKSKLMVCLLALLVAFGSGGYVGYQFAKSDPAHVRSVFTPYEDGLANYLEFLDTAKKTVHVAGYAFTDDRIVDKLVELQRDRGVKVHVLLDRSQTLGWSAPKERAAIIALRAAGAEVVIGTSEKSSEIMHHKFTVVDAIAVQDGSWNYTKAANKQANLLNFQVNPERAQLFLKHWKRMHDFMVTQPQTLPPVRK